jgi:hypothetical protein
LARENQGQNNQLLDNNRENADIPRSNPYCTSERGCAVPQSIFDAIKLGHWDFEPPQVDYREFDPSDAMPGTRAKLAVLAERLRLGLPLWHAEDRNDSGAPPVGKRMA